VSVRAKLFLAMAPLVLAIVAIGVVTALTATRLGGNPEEILRQNYQSILAAQAMREALERLDAAATLDLAGRRDSLHGAPAYRERFVDALLLQEASVFESGERTPTARLRDEWQGYQDAYARFAAAASGADGAVARLYADELRPRLERIKRLLDEIVTVNQRGMFDKSTWARQTAHRTVGTVIVAAVAALLTALPLSTLLVRRVLRRLEHVTHTAERLGGGDFAARVEPTGSDEIAILGARFDQMAERLAGYRATSLGKLLAAQRTLQAAIDSIPDPLLVFDAEARLVGANGAAGTLLGIAAGEPARDALAALPAAMHAAVVRARDHVLHERAPYLPRGIDEAVSVIGESGRVFLLVRAAPVGDGGGRVAATVILQEVTRLRQLDDLRSDLVATVAHELRTPLTSLRMAILLCVENAGGDAQARLLATARDDCERLQSTVDELLDLARLQSRETQLRRRTVRAGTLLDTARAHADSAARERGVALVTPPVSDGVAVAADAERLQLVFSNLLANAVRHSPPGGTVLLEALAVDSAVRFEVADEGAGIAAEHLPYVFERFYRVPGAPPGGVGLGLAIAREVVMAHGGEIGVDSRAGRGSRFWFTVPRAAPTLVAHDS
jgi:two-component system, NtrC family, sensor histidine kinase KinB